MAKASWPAGDQHLKEWEWLRKNFVDELLPHDLKVLGDDLLTIKETFFKSSEWNHQAKDWTKRIIEVAFLLNFSWTHILYDFHIVLTIWCIIAFIK